MTNASPADIERLQQVDWFHSYDFGNGITVKGFKSLEIVRDEAEILFGNLDLNGSSVLDIGTWSGYHAIEAEKRGAARVVGSDHYAWNSRPKGREPFDLARKMFNSKVEALEIDVPDISPKTVGTFNTVLFLGVFYHLFDAPTLTAQIAGCASDLLILETHQDALDTPRPAMIMYPDGTLNGDTTNWWGPNPQCIYEILRKCGFKRIFYVDGANMPTDPQTPTFRQRGIYFAFRDDAAVKRMKKGAANWMNLSDPSVRQALFAPITAGASPPGAIFEPPATIRYAFGLLRRNIWRKLTGR